ncbi:MAG TPA: PLP-dependent aspartate aminotransferase family protein [Candidatus Binataceae bacterium]|nr:PLP-dependent aspartate aminotransferase family protein [Candidatus Binataceae bacterium]
MDDSKMRIDTRLIHAGEPTPRIEGAVSMPIFQSSTFEYRGESDYHALRYIRLNNTPNHVALHRKLAAVEAAEDALVTASGMAAVSATLLTLLGSGDHLILQDCLYGGTHDLLTTEFPRLGIEYTLVDGNAPASWPAALRSTTRAVYFESISNPLNRVADLKAGIRFARAHGLSAIIDNTFTSPINFRPATLGFDLSIHSGTKYLNGHSDIVAGAVIGRRELISRINRTMAHLGGSLDPHACFLLHRGLKTLALRVRHQNESALRIARFLAAHPKIAAVNYPGLETHPDYARARELFDGCGGVLSFELKGGVAAADTLIRTMRLPISAPSLGGVESLITRPATTSHSGMSAAARARAGIADGLVRLAVGLEAPEDLVDDLGAALAQV